jgi:DNA-directed RNA polymerase specialized sigma24 family protein
VGGADLADAATRAYLRSRPAARRHGDDLRQSVALALLTALPRWDARRGAVTTFLGRRADGAVLDAVRSEMRRRPEPLAAHEPAALDPAFAAVDARLDAAALLSRLDARTADLLRRVYADGESLRAAGRAVGIGETRAHQLAHEGLAAVRGCR